MASENLLFGIWILGAVVVTSAGVQILLLTPGWLEWFPTVWVAFLATVVLPTGFLTLLGKQWLVGRSHE